MKSQLITAALAALLVPIHGCYATDNGYCFDWWDTGADCEPAADGGGTGGEEVEITAESICQTLGNDIGIPLEPYSWPGVSDPWATSTPAVRMVPLISEVGIFKGWQWLDSPSSAAHDVGLQFVDGTLSVEGYEYIIEEYGITAPDYFGFAVVGNVGVANVNLSNDAGGWPLTTVYLDGVTLVYGSQPLGGYTVDMECHSAQCWLPGTADHEDPTGRAGPSAATIKFTSDMHNGVLWRLWPRKIECKIANPALDDGSGG